MMWPALLLCMMYFMLKRGKVLCIPYYNACFGISWGFLSSTCFSLLYYYLCISCFRRGKSAMYLQCISISWDYMISIFVSSQKNHTTHLILTIVKPNPSQSKNNLPCKYGSMNQKAKGRDVISTSQVFMIRGVHLQIHSNNPIFPSNFSAVTGIKPQQKKSKCLPITILDGLQYEPSTSLRSYLSPR